MTNVYFHPAPALCFLCMPLIFWKTIGNKYFHWFCYLLHALCFCNDHKMILTICFLPMVAMLHSDWGHGLFRPSSCYTTILSNTGGASFIFYLCIFRHTGRFWPYYGWKSCFLRMEVLLPTAAERSGDQIDMDRTKLHHRYTVRVLGDKLTNIG